MLTTLRKLMGRNGQDQNQCFPVHVVGSDICFDVNAGETVLKAATRQGVVMPSLCNVGECGSCRCVLDSGDVQLKKDVSHQISAKELAHGAVLACQCVPLSAISLIVPTLSPSNDGSSALVNSEATITGMRYLCSDIIQLDLLLETSIVYQGGQFAHLRLPDSPAIESRSYSFATASIEATTQVSFFIRHVVGGQFTDWLFANDRVAEKLLLTAPFGEFVVRSSPNSILFIAAGSGIAPVLALLEEALETEATFDVEVLFSARTVRDYFCENHLIELKKSWPKKFSIKPFLTREPQTSSWRGERRRLTGSLEERTDLDEHSIYICGSCTFVDACLHSMDSKQDKTTIFYDRFLSRSDMQSEEVK